MTASLTPICLQIEMKNFPASLGVKCGHQAILGREYRYKLVVTQISHDSGLAPIPYTGRKLLLQRPTL